jgi:hypothetical protein
MADTIKSIDYDQHNIIKSIMTLCNIDRFDADFTFGNGSFYKGIEPPLHRFDLDDTLDNLTGVANSSKVPLGDSSIKSIMFDPPFLTYIKAGRTGNGGMVMARRFGGYWRYDELEEHYRATLREAHRTLGKKGILVFKCQDIIHNHKMHCTHANVLLWAAGMFRLKDMFILMAKRRMPKMNSRGTQLHARIYHSYFLVLEKI